MNCKHRRSYEFDWTNMKPCQLCAEENEMETRKKIPLNHFTSELINAAKQEIYTDPSSGDNLETLGVLVSKYCEWSVEDIVKVFLEALGDANFSTLAGEIDELTTEYFKGL